MTNLLTSYPGKIRHFIFQTTRDLTEQKESIKVRTSEVIRGENEVLGRNLIFACGSEKKME